MTSIVMMGGKRMEFKTPFFFCFKVVNLCWLSSKYLLDGFED